jgi:hypothetical protein
MKLLRDYLCESCGTMQERFLDTSIEEVACSCGEIAKRVIGMPKVMLDGTDASFPGAYDKWARIREDNARIKSKRSYAE